MSCYHPITCYDVAPKGEKKKELVFSASKALEHGPLRPVTVPCRQCLGCRLDYSRQWANRCMLELPYHKSSYFLTITYDDEHLPRSYACDPDTGEIISPAAPLVKRDFQLFMKRLRFNTGQKLRFMAAGEYGETTFRPHFHAIVFGLELNDLTPYKHSALGYQYWNSPTLDKCWTDENGKLKGYIVAGDVSWDTCAYVARYIMKKQMGPHARQAYAALGLTPEFSLMSRRPGIAKQYYLDHPEIWDYVKINISTPQGGRSFAHPAYLRKLYEIDEPDKALELSEKRRLYAIRNNNHKKRLTDLELCNILRVEEEVKERRIKSLIRNII